MWTNLWQWKRNVEETIAQKITEKNGICISHHFSFIKRLSSVVGTRVVKIRGWCKHSSSSENQREKDLEDDPGKDG